MKQVVCAVEDRAGEVKAVKSLDHESQSATETGFV